MLRLITLGGLRLERDGAVIFDKMRPRRLALLAILAAAGPNGLTREAVLAILWSESSPERARHSLAQEIYALRRELNLAVIPAGPTLRLDPDYITSDLAELRSAIAAGDSAAIDALDTGPFLDGFYISNAPDFERWLDGERASIRRDVIAALERSALEQESDNGPGAIAVWERLVRLDPLRGRFTAGLMRAQVQSGDRAGALAAGQAHVRFVERELGVQADDTVLRLIDELRAQPTPSRAVASSSPRDAGEVHTSWPRRPSMSWARESRPYVVVVVSLDRLARHWKPVALAASLLVAAAIVGSIFWRRADAAGSTPSQATAPVVLRLYESGQRALYQGDYSAAGRLFDAALAEDSSFAPAAYFAWRAEVASEGPNEEARRARALELAAHASERDAQLIRLHTGLSRYELGAAALADSLARRFPDDPDVLMRAAEATGDLPAAVALLDRAMRIDSAQATSATNACRACEALRMLARRYDWADSSSAVLRTLERWRAIRPADYWPSLAQFDYLTKLDRASEAGAARRRADSLGAPHGLPASSDVERAIRTGSFAAADSLCNSAPSALSDSIAALIRLRRACALGLRVQGRLREALTLVHDAKTPWPTERGKLPPDLELGSAIDMEMGRPFVAAAWHARVAGDSSESSAPSASRSHRIAWHLTLAATALAQAHDSVRVRTLIDSVELLGHRSADPRDPLLHHFLRGLLLSMAGEHESAVREYRLASTMPAHDFARIGYEMARSLMAAHRPLEAIPPLRALLHADFDDAALMLTPTDVHLSLGEAFEAAGQRDSSAVHYAAVERAWRRADPSFAPRYQTVRTALLRTARSSR